MKKLLAVLFALIFVLSCFAGCGNKKEEDTTEASDSGEVEKEDKDAEEEDEDEDEDEEETTKKKSKKDDAEEEDEDEEETTKKKSKKDDDEEEDEDEEETTKKAKDNEVTVGEPAGAKSVDALAKAYFKAAYQDMDINEVFDLVSDDFFEAISEEQEVAFDLVKKELFAAVADELDEIEQDYEADDIDTADLTYETEITYADEAEVEEIYEELAEYGFEGKMTAGVTIELSVIDADGVEYTWDDIAAAEIDGVWYVLESDIVCL